MVWDDENTIFRVVVNDEEQYSIWPIDKEIPRGWRDVGRSGKKDECLAYIKEVWTDMRPLSLRKKMEEDERKRAEGGPEPAPTRKPRFVKTVSGDELVDRLAEGDHPVVARMRPDKSPKLLKEAIDRGYVLVTFTDTKGGTELGVPLDRGASRLDAADFEKATGTIHVEGDLILNYVRVRCVADIDLATLEGRGRLVPLKE